MNICQVRTSGWAPSAALGSWLRLRPTSHAQPADSLALPASTAAVAAGPRRFPHQPPLCTQVLIQDFVLKWRSSRGGQREASLVKVDGTLAEREASLLPPGGERSAAV